MVNYIDKIEKYLGDYKKLPNSPFHSKCEYALFPALNEDLVDKSLYKALFEANKNQGNCVFIANSFLGMKGENNPILEQNEFDWLKFESFQNSPLVYEGFYMTSENFDWLGIYHPDDYIILGGNDELTGIVAKQLYGIENWKTKFDEAFAEGAMNMYEADYRIIQKSLIK